MKIQLALAALIVALSPSAFAQNRGNSNGQNGGNRGGRTGGTLPLPKGVDRVISIDAYNMLLAETTDDNGDRNYTPIIVHHVYSGGIAALFGGTSIPTEQFVSPGSFDNGGGNNFSGGNNNFSGGNNNFSGGGNNFSGGGNNFSGGGNNFSGGGNSNFSGGNNNFSGGGSNFNGMNGFSGTGFNQGFNGASNGQIFQTPNGDLGIAQTSVVNPDGTTTPLVNGSIFGR